MSSNAKDIRFLYLIFALFSGMLGTTFSVLIRLKLAGLGLIGGHIGGTSFNSGRLGAARTMWSNKMEVRRRLKSTGIVGINRTRRYSTLATPCLKLDPNWITGFIDGEGSYVVSIQRNLKNSIG